MIHEKIGDRAGLVTVTDVETTSDLQLSTVHVSVLGKEPEQSRTILQEHAPYFQAQLGRKLTMKFTPKLTFAINDEERRGRIEKLLEQL